ncbi:AraC-type DNA-binding protein [Paenibacillus uliginis N3/975]|uniref:AraC-type DNA-binding protein n=1 Tax=Paenibacillus uliginis N3/975 TaxID=1313296 RepID=A0A1X7HER6_9BACL|nr:AraC family transcriptional regulator [Paenibacillus uliginis]SMF84674.1 AraC-type DNA-binding protein [Paenibacillus uliginis N3/975]
MQIKNIMIDQSLKELTQHRTVELPVACYETTINHNIHGYIPLHWHDELQFVYIVRGEALFQINDEEMVIRQGEGLFINSGCLHMAEDWNDTRCTYICLNVSPQFVLPKELHASYVYPYIQATNVPYYFLNPNESFGKEILDAIVKINQCIQKKPPRYEIDISVMLTFIWRSIVSNTPQIENDQTENMSYQRIKRMLNWIHQHYTEKIRLEDIARVGQLSRSETCRYFKRMIKTSPLSYVIEYRIQQSLDLLRRPESNVTEVAYQVGFNSTSYFIDKFSKSMNMTPLAYKKNQLEQWTNSEGV